MASHEINPEFGATGQKTLPAYIIGFVLCIIITLIAFYCVQNKLLSDAGLYILLSVLAVTQLIVQSICFLGLKTDKEGRLNLMPFIFTLLIIAILVSGTLWIMYNLNYNMMT